MSQKQQILRSKLDEIEQRYERIEKQLAEPEVASDSSKLISLAKQQGKIRDIVTQYRRYKQVIDGITDVQEILRDTSIDADFAGLAKQELENLQNEEARLSETILENLVMSDDRDIGSVIVEIRAGTGGEEAALFARDLYDMYVKYAEFKHWKVENFHFSPSERNGFKEVIFSIAGRGVWAEIGLEAGGHRVQRVPQTESQGRIHTSAATVAVLPEPEQLEIQIEPNEVQEHVSRSSGPGGQSVNKLSSAVKLTHKPTGISVSMQDEKSQHKNRAKAWRILKGRVFEYHQSKKRAQRDSLRKSMIGSGDRSQKIRTYNYPQNRITDHRINLSLYCLDKIMAGDLSELIGALGEYEKQQRLQNL